MNITDKILLSRTCVCTPSSLDLLRAEKAPFAPLKTTFPPFPGNKTETLKQAQRSRTAWSSAASHQNKAEPGRWRRLEVSGLSRGPPRGPKPPQPPEQTRQCSAGSHHDNNRQDPDTEQKEKHSRQRVNSNPRRSASDTSPGLHVLAPVPSPGVWDCTSGTGYPQTIAASGGPPRAEA